METLIEVLEELWNWWFGKILIIYAILGIVAQIMYYIVR